jgi:threonine/homoserine/homoserine lactone efflux protein
MSFPFLAVFLTTVLVASITPGPSMLLALNHGICFGWRRALATAWGNVVATALQCLVSFAGLGFILAQAAWVFSAIRWAGAVYLVYLGCRLLFGPTEALIGDGSDGQPRRSLFREAFVVTVSNPKAVFFFSALFPQFFADGGLSPAKATVMLVAVLVTTFGCMMLYATAGARIQGLFGRPRFRAMFQRSVGATLVGFGAGLALERR